MVNGLFWQTANRFTWWSLWVPLGISGVNVKHVQIVLEDGTGLVRVILWQKQKECTAQRHLIDKCNGNHYICVIGEVEDYYGVHEIIYFNVQPVSSGNKVTHHFLEVAYSYEKRLECIEDEMMKSVPFV